MAIDINSGKIAGKTNFESMALRTNMEAAETIAQQLKLRDIGGQIVVDFIEMRDRNHWREVEKTLRAAMKNDRARHDVGKMSRFGLLQIVRQRLGSSALSISTEPCPCCKGTGLRRNMEWQAMQALKDIHRQLRATTASSLRWEAPEELGMYLLNHKRGHLTELENRFERDIDIAIRR
jgi:ribonuclease E